MLSFLVQLSSMNVRLMGDFALHVIRHVADQDADRIMR